jgi:hypothetical protein
MVAVEGELVIPLIEPMLALAVLHSPPVDALLSIVVIPAHTFIVPVIGDGSAFTVTTYVTRHPAEFA